MQTLKIGTRGSPLALAQAHETQARLMQAHGLPEQAFEVMVISTSGDRIQDRPLSEAGGKVQTRLRKLDDGIADGTILAYAGLKRLGLENVVTDLMPLEDFPPAPGQGAIGIETRIGDRDVEKMLEAVHHVPTGQALACE